jgi:hypothetical protein
MGLFDIGDGVAEEAGDPVSLPLVPGIGLIPPLHQGLKVGGRGHVTGSTAVAVGFRLLGDPPVELVGKVAAGMGRMLKFVIDRFVALFAGVVVQIIA